MKIKDIIEKYREIILYLFFGVATTAVSWIVYFGIMWFGRGIFSIPVDAEFGGAYMALYTAAQIISWICAVLFAFYTNRKWVFTDAEKNVSAFRQLTVFASGRVVTLGLDYVVTLGGTVLLSAVLPMLDSFTVPVIEKTVNANEILSKFAAAVLVIIGNYVFSKLFVFKKAEGGK